MRQVAFNKYAKENLIEERLVSAQVSFNLVAVFLGVAMLLIFLAWLVEYLLVGTILTDWMSQRWYVAVGIMLVVVVDHRRRSDRRRRQLDQLFELSSPMGEYLGLRPNSKFATGGVRFSGSVVGPVTLSVDGNGLVFWRRGEMKAFFPWARFQQIRVRHNSPDICFAELLLNWPTRLPPPGIVIPWAEEMSRYVPAEIGNDDPL